MRKQESRDRSKVSYLQLDSFLWHIMMTMGKSSIGSIISKGLYVIKLPQLWNMVSYHLDKKNPTEEMKNAYEFFSKETSKARIEKIVSLLEDEESKSVYLGCIKFRYTHDFKDRPKYNTKNQYFPNDILSISEKEVFVDCGAYNGDTIRSFKKYAKKGYKKIIAFEPDQANIDMIRRYDKNITIIPAAVWCEDTQLGFCGGGGAVSRIADNTDEQSSLVPARAIDTVAECEDATFIKMDIEGAEFQALNGAKKTIVKNRPKLAICIYHSDEDMLRLIELIDGWNLGYKFYVRHHAQKISETVVYAV